MRDFYALDPDATYVMQLPKDYNYELIDTLSNYWKTQTKAKIIFIAGAELLKLREETK